MKMSKIKVALSEVLKLWLVLNITFISCLLLGVNLWLAAASAFIAMVWYDIRDGKYKPRTDRKS